MFRHLFQQIPSIMQSGSALNYKKKMEDCESLFIIIIGIIRKRKSVYLGNKYKHQPDCRHVHDATFRLSQYSDNEYVCVL